MSHSLDTSHPQIPISAPPSAWDIKTSEQGLSLANIRRV